MILEEEDGIGMVVFSVSAAHSLYDYYSREHIQAVATFIEQRYPGGRVLEVGAGDGRLTRFLEWAGIKMLQPTDVRDERRSECDIKVEHYGTNVKAMEATQAVRKYKPDLVVWAWPPYQSHVPEDILDLGYPLLYIGEGNGGCCAADALWGYPNEMVDSCLGTQICRTDIAFSGRLMAHHSRTILFRPAE